MRILGFILLLVCTISGVFCLIYALYDSRKIYFGVEASKRKQLINSGLTGLSATLIFMAVMLFGGIRDSNYLWTIKGIIIELAISLIPGIIVMLGTYWGFLSVGKYRKFIYQKLIDKHNTTKKSG